MIITIDGPAGSGKSTISKRLAKKLGYDVFDTGAMYRSLTWYFIKNEINIEDEESVKKALETFNFEIKSLFFDKRYFVNKEDVTSFIRSFEVNNLVSKVSSKKYIREIVIKLQRSYAKDKNAIFEGRDMGTVVFPHADVKFFLTADIKVRAKRRFLEIKKIDKNVSYYKVFEELQKRDDLDSKREFSPLYCAKDAFEINTSKLTIKKIVKKMVSRIKKEKKAIPGFFKMHFFYATILFFVFLFFKIFYRLKVYGIYNFKKGAAIIASNHVSYYDPCVIAVSSKEEVHYLARASLFKIPILGRLIKKLNAHPVSKSSQNVYMMKKVLKVLKEGKKIILFPEGRRSKTGNILDIMPGIGHLVCMSHCLIIPTYVEGTYKIWKRGKKFPKLFGKIRCVFGKPIDVRDFQFKDRKECIKIINETLQKKLFLIKKWCEEGFKGDPP